MTKKSSTTAKTSSDNAQLKKKLEDPNLSDDEDIDFSQETLYDRLVALGDMFPQHKREQLVEFISEKAETSLYILKKLGSVAWIVTTSTLIVFVPYLLESEREAQFALMEQETYIQQKALVNGGGANAAAANANPQVNAPVRQ